MLFKTNLNYLVPFAYILTLLKISTGYFINIEAQGEECFFEKVTSNTKMNLMFEVAQGGFLDIDFKIFGPDGKIIHSGDKETNGKYIFAAHMDGTYKYCFSNTMSALTPKTVVFSIDVGEKPKDTADEANDASHIKLADMINELSSTLTGIKHEQEYMEVRDGVHRSINDNTNSRVVLWSFFEALVVVAMTLGQVYYIKRFFEVRRLV